MLIPDDVIYDTGTGGLIANRIADDNPEIVGWDTETVGCNPRKESPVNKAVAYIQSFAWRNKHGEVTAGVLHGEDVKHTKVAHPKRTLVGHNLWGFDRHVINVPNPIHDTLVMSRLLNPSRDFGHGLKAWGERLGYDVTRYGELVCRPRHSNQVESYKRSHTKTKQYCSDCNRAWEPAEYCLCGCSVSYSCPVTITAGAEWQKVNFNSYEALDLKQVWDEYPQRRQKILDYAVQDAVLHLELYEHLKTELEKVRW